MADGTGADITTVAVYVSDSWTMSMLRIGDEVAPCTQAPTSHVNTMSNDCAQVLYRMGGSQEGT